eukprot:TRINITY_DN6402_c0_g3_i3.p2 TRINITY_DN6402_c0_g3~~TRINITY_DN6402_c0_g3_i3.p2  ORF type:complete len:252 (+),score=45.84 TRINITY_DN6402_c0_g3_i3:69-824(+)
MAASQQTSQQPIGDEAARDRIVRLESTVELLLKQLNEMHSNTAQQRDDVSARTAAALEKLAEAEAVRKGDAPSEGRPPWEANSVAKEWGAFLNGERKWELEASVQSELVTPYVGLHATGEDLRKKWEALSLWIGVASNTPPPSRTAELWKMGDLLLQDVQTLSYSIRTGVPAHKIRAARKKTAGELGWVAQAAASATKGAGKKGSPGKGGKGSKGGKGGKGVGPCYVCGAYGHLAATCPHSAAAAAGKGQG